jgi:rubrerythrin
LSVDVRSTDREGGHGVLEINESADDESADFVQFVAAGQQVKGEFHCADCGYGVTVYRELPVCPMCGNDSWEQSAWSPFARARILQ